MREKTAMNPQHLRITLYNDGNNSVSRYTRHTHRLSSGEQRKADKKRHQLTLAVLSFWLVYVYVLVCITLYDGGSNALLIRFIHKVCLKK